VYIFSDSYLTVCGQSTPHCTTFTGFLWTDLSRSELVGL